MQALLGHHGQPSLCRHGEDDGLHTEYAIVGLPREGRVRFCHGQPCQAQYQEIPL